MLNNHLSIQRIAYFLISLVILTYILIVGKGFFVPICFGTFLAFILKPIASLVERLLGSRTLGAALSLLLFSCSILAILTIFGLQISNLLANSESIIESLEDGANRLLYKFGGRFGLQQNEATKLISEGIGEGISGPLNVFFSGLSSSTIILTQLGLSLIYTFFFLLYRTAIKRFILGQFEPGKRKEVRKVLGAIQSVAAKYLYGLGLVMLILGLLNSLGLTLIGIKYAFFWGFLAALLAVVPYVGAFIGGLLPFIYAFATTDSLFYPLAVAGFYVFIQFVEGNFITPKIVGSSVNINPLFAIMGLIIGASIWGVVGMILALPLLAIARIIFSHIPAMQAIALLLSDELYTESDKFLGKLDRPSNRLRTIFLLRRKPKQSNSDDTEIVEVVEH
ncbi:MAG: AI-2E family transporter [Bacteroidota bacterium]